MSNSYDEIREKNIARNNKVLEQLGFGLSLLPTSPAPLLDRSATKRKQKREFKDPVVGTRSSKRLKAEAGGAALDTAGVLPPPKAIKVSKIEFEAHPALKFFSSEPESQNKSTIKWDTKRKHQHLEISSSKRTVATTGCAGYGAVLACADTAAVVSKKLSEGKPQSWSVQMVTEGVGGCSIGISAANAKAPYKSMGKRPDSWVLHSSGCLLHNRSTSSNSSEYDVAYSEGDIIDINLSALGELSFRVKGELVLKTAVRVPEGKYTLCCQPYMGGVCRIL